MMLEKRSTLEELRETGPYIIGPGWYYDKDDVMLVVAEGEQMYSRVWLEKTLEEIRETMTEEVKRLPVMKVEIL